MIVIFLLALLAPHSLGCAPVSPTNGTKTAQTSSKGTFSMTINPPAAWTTSTSITLPQKLSVAQATQAMNTDIEQAVKSLFYEKAQPVDTVNVTVNHNTALDDVKIIEKCKVDEGGAGDDGDGYVLDTNDNVYAQCKAGEYSEPFEVTITGSFDTGSPGLAVTTAMWDALAVSLQNKLSIPPYNIRFQKLLTITPTATSD